MTAPTRPYQPPPVDSGLTPAQMAAILALVQAQAALRKRLTDTAIAAILGPIRALGADVFWNDTAYRTQVRRALRIVQPAQRQAAQITNAYTVRATRLMTGKTPPAAPLVDVTALRKAMPAQVAEDLAAGNLKPGWVELGNLNEGPSEHIDEPLHLAIPEKGAKVLDPVEPYERIAEQYRYDVVAEGVPEPKARQRALVRLELAAHTDVTLAVREQYRKSLGKVNAVGWRRVLHPELTETGPCGLCVVAADRLYRISELKPIHRRCACEILPVIQTRSGDILDPGIELNRQELAALYDAAGGTGGEVIKGGRRHSGKLKHVRVALAEHAELGPVLTDADEHYRGPVDVAKAKVPDRAARARTQLEALLAQHDITRARAERGETSGNPVRWQAAKIAELRTELERLEN